MFSALIALCALAQDELEYIEEEELYEYLGILPIGETPALDGVTAKWASARGVVEVTITNTGTDMLQIDWNQTSFIDANKEAFGVVPSKVRQIDVEKLVAFDVVPPGTSLGTFIFQEARDSGAERLYDAGNLGDEIAISLALVRGGTTSWLRQTFRVDYTDREALVALNACREGLAEWRRIEATTVQPKRMRDWGVGLAAGGLLFAAVAAIPPYTGEDAPPNEGRVFYGVFGGGTSVSGVLMMALSTKDLRRTRADLAAAGPMPDCL